MALANAMLKSCLAGDPGEAERARIEAALASDPGLERNLMALDRMAAPMRAAICVDDMIGLASASWAGDCMEYLPIGGRDSALIEGQVAEVRAQPGAPI